MISFELGIAGFELKGAGCKSGELTEGIVNILLQTSWARGKNWVK
jgi:hypothetical protein